MQPQAVAPLPAPTHGGCGCAATSNAKISTGFAAAAPSTKALGGGGIKAAIANNIAPVAPPAPRSATEHGDPSKWLTGDLDGLNPVLLDKLALVGQRLGRKLQIDSGHRSRAEQEKLYARYTAGQGPIAARPGTSRHESGNAADVKVAGGKSLRDDPAAKVAAAELGLKFPVPSESWHVELA